MSSHVFRSVAYTILLTVTTQSPLSGQDCWPGFRGNGSGVAIDVSLPKRWSLDDGVAWKAPIAGYGQSSPVIWKGSVFVTSTDGPFQEKCMVHAYELSTGELRWTRTVAASSKAENYFRNSRAAPTSAVDANAVYSFFPGGDLVSLGHNGDRNWIVPLIKRFGEVDNERCVASSIAQTDESLFVVIDHHGPSYLVAIDKRSGGIRWKADRGHRVPSWSSPVIAENEGRQFVVISSSDTVDAYDVGSGDRVWQVDGLKGNHIPSAAVVGNRLFVGSTTMYGGASDPNEVAGSNCCIELTSEAGRPSYRVRWSAEKANSYYSSPLAFAGYVYYVNKVGVLYCVDQETGKQVFAKRIGNPCWASAIGVRSRDGEELVYFVQKNGFTVVLRPGEEYDQVARNQLWNASAMVEDARAAAALRKENTVPPDQAKPKTGPERVFAGLPESQLHQMFSYGDPTVYGAAAVDGCLVIRTGQHLFCIRAR